MLQCEGPRRPLIVESSGVALGRAFCTEALNISTAQPTATHSFQLCTPAAKDRSELKNKAFRSPLPATENSLDWMSHHDTERLRSKVDARLWIIRSPLTLPPPRASRSSAQLAGDRISLSTLPNTNSQRSRAAKRKGELGLKGNPPMKQDRPPPPFPRNTNASVA